MKRLHFLLCIMIFFLVAAGQASAAENVKTVWVTPYECEETDEIPDCGVQWYQKGKEYYIFLPGNTNWAELRLWFEGNCETLTVGGQSLHSGDRLEGIAEGDSVKLTVGKKEYTIHFMQGSSIPALFISTDSGSLEKIHHNKNTKEPGKLLMVDEKGNTDYNGKLTHIKMRGNTSTTLSKKNYGFKLENGADLAGLGKAKRWVLLGSYRDHSQIRNQVVLSMAKYVGLRYTPDFTPVDVYMNHAYHGTYLLTEKIEINNNRVDIADLEKANEEANPLELESYPTIGSKKVSLRKWKAYQLENDPEDITGGYIIEYENFQARYSTELCAYTTRKGKVLLVKAPEIVSQAEMEYISGFMQAYENAIFAEDGIDPDTGKHYSEYVDFDSLVLKYMLEEVSMNCDGNASSQYYVKPSDSESKVAFAGPAWDYDTCLGAWASKKKSKLLKPDVFLHNTVNASKYWWPQLYAKEEFFTAVCEKWESTYSHALLVLLGKEKDATGKLLSVNEYAEEIRKSAEMNFIRWPIPAYNQDSGNIARTGLTFDENIQYLSDFIQQRYDFLNTEWAVQ